MQETFSSSEYARTVAGAVAGLPPALDLAYEKRLHDYCLDVMRRGFVAAAHDVSEGGLLVALAEMGFAAEARCGVAVTLGSKLPLEAVCFGEEPSRIILEVEEIHLADLLRLAAQYEVEARQLGWVTPGEFRVHFNGKIVLEEDVDRLAELWRTALPRQLHGAAT